MTSIGQRTPTKSTGNPRQAARGVGEDAQRLGVGLVMADIDHDVKARPTVGRD